jgi:hypothetical protein
MKNLSIVLFIFIHTASFCSEYQSSRLRSSSLSPSAQTFAATHVPKFSSQDKVKHVAKAVVLEALYNNTQYILVPRAEPKQSNCIISPYSFCNLYKELPIDTDENNEKKIQFYFNLFTSILDAKPITHCFQLDCTRYNFASASLKLFVKEELIGSEHNTSSGITIESKMSIK